MKDTYLGDGVYASHMGDTIKLDLRGQKEFGGELVEIVLEDNVMIQLIEYRERLCGELRKEL